MRCQQFIGLTNSAKDFVRHLKSLPGEYIDNYWGGYELRRWQYEEFDHVVQVKEVVQAEPWSSGPMIFTCLELIWTNDSGQDFKTRCLEWVMNPLLSRYTKLALNLDSSSYPEEYDEKKGEYYV